MCIATKYLNELESMISNIEKDFQKLREEAQKYDKELAEYYHTVEHKVFNAAEGYYIAKELQILLRKRRLVKNELSSMDSLIKTLGLGNLHNKLTHSTKHVEKVRKKNKDYTEGWDIDSTFVDELILH
ncbi:hypothetical protein [Heyndrickxia camelliae]|uniref:Uncharacterized protein n=1 Tax=Heyndrickxia camelliae TaxID=1707093 RepID=A0A2N3LCW5_9BACI|nr:hypothetical protein [Heyndrickxia camelliae]PKR82426.1 hypothetical protein CWO92_24595 [Heyndrickxia camelliae]